MKLIVNKKKVIVFLYIMLSLAVCFRAFSRAFTDQLFLQQSYFISQGFTPYTDFFSHHFLIHSFMYAPVFWIFKSVTSRLYFFLAVSIIGILFSAWLIYKISGKNGFKNPHIASLLFLSSIAAVPNIVVRSDFFILLILLGFLYTKKQFLRGLFVALIITSNIVWTVPLSIAMLLYCWTGQFKKKQVFRIIAGMLTGVLFWSAVHNAIDWSSIYFWVFTFNAKISDIYYVSFNTLVIFTLAVFPIIILAMLLSKNHSKNSDTTFITSLLILSLLQTIFLNIIFGFPTRFRMYEYIPLIAIACIYASELSYSKGITVVIVSFLLSFIIITPSFDFQIKNFIEYSQKLDECISPTGKIYYLDEPEAYKELVVFRPLGEYFWFLKKNLLIPANISYTQIYVENNVTVCDIYFDTADLTCNMNEIKNIQKYCEGVGFPSARDISRPSIITTVLEPIRKSSFFNLTKKFVMNQK